MNNQLSLPSLGVPSAQLIVFMALAQGSSRYLASTLTLHTRTAIAVAEQMVGCKFKCTQVGPAEARNGNGKRALTDSKDLWLVECNGAGHSRSF